jgi:hypothetical protein
MADKNKRGPDCDDCGDEKGERGKRGPRGHRGHRGDDGVPGDTGPTGATGADGPQFEPARTLFVAESWPAGSDPAVYFTTITAALAQAATMSPSFVDAIGIYIYPGSYNEATLTLISNVSLIGNSWAVKINANMVWNAGAGVNLPQKDVPEVINLIGLLVQNNSISMDSSAKPNAAGAFSLLHSVDCTFRGFTAIGRAGASQSDEAFFNGCNLLNAPNTFTNMDGVTPGVQLTSTRFRSLIVNGDSRCDILGGSNIAVGGGAITVADTAQVLAEGITFNNPITVSSTAAIGFKLYGGALNAALTVNAGSNADVRSSNYVQKANLVGPGGINRTTWNDTTVATVNGANAVVFAVPYPPGETSYNVLTQLVTDGGSGGLGCTVSNKTNTGFTLNDPSAGGGNVFDYTVVQE